MQWILQGCVRIQQPPAGSTVAASVVFAVSPNTYSFTGTAAAVGSPTDYYVCQSLTESPVADTVVDLVLTTTVDSRTTSDVVLAVS